MREGDDEAEVDGACSRVVRERAGGERVRGGQGIRGVDAAVVVEPARSRGAGTHRAGDRARVFARGAEVVVEVGGARVRVTSGFDGALLRRSFVRSGSRDAPVGRAGVRRARPGRHALRGGAALGDRARADRIRAARRCAVRVRGPAATARQSALRGTPRAYVVFYKRLDAGTFSLPASPAADATHVEIDESALDALLDGIVIAPEGDVSGASPRRRARRVH